jgi:hypothetical protein
MTRLHSFPRAVLLNDTQVTLLERPNPAEPAAEILNASTRSTCCIRMW